MIRTYKRKLKLTKTQEQKLASWVGACRVVYNLGLEVKIAAYKTQQKSVSKYDLANQLPDLKKEVSWIADVPAQTLQAVVERLELAYQSFFRGGGFPKWANKRWFNSLTLKQGVKVLGSNKIQIPKLGELKFFNDSLIQGKVKTAQIIKELTGWYICVQFEANHIQTKIGSEKQAIGIDLGIASFATLSNGSDIANPKLFTKYERKLRLANRSLARKKKGSASWQKQAHKTALLHNKIKNVRKDFLHKQSTAIANQYSLVFLEDLKIKNMSKSAKGNAEEHGKNVNAKAGLNRSILDCGWGMFGAFLAYKTTVIKVDAKYTSQTYNVCGHKSKENRLTQAKFTCVSCGHKENADLNAAKNIKSKGIAHIRQREALACA